MNEYNAKKLYCCSNCGEVAIWDNCDHFLEKGSYQYSCRKCGEWVTPAMAGKQEFRAYMTKIVKFTPKIKRIIVRNLFAIVHQRRLRGWGMRNRLIRKVKRLEARIKQLEDEKACSQN